jgi:hypothetical protein
VPNNLVTLSHFRYMDNVENHPGRKKKREEKVTNLREILRKYGKVQLKDYMDMVQPSTTARWLNNICVSE